MDWTLLVLVLSVVYINAGTVSGEDRLSFQPESTGQTDEDNLQSSEPELTQYDEDPRLIWPNNTLPGVEIRKILRKCSSMHSSSDLKNCTRKIEISLRLVNKGKMSTAVEYMLVNSVHDEMTGQIVYLVEPLVIQIQQQQVSLAYDIEYIKSINSKPYELVMNDANTEDFPGCYTDRNAMELCADLAVGSTYSPGPTGYCCRCDPGGDHKATDRRSVCAKSKSKTMNRATSAHCLKFSPLWYSVHRLGPGQVNHVVRVKIYRQSYAGDYGTNITWRKLGDTALILGTDRHTVISKDGWISGSYVKKIGTEIPTDLDPRTSYLLIPEPVYTTDSTTPNEIKHGVNNYLLLDEEELTFEGTECNKAGISYPGFLSQRSRCIHSQQSCLSEQPRDFWIRDVNEEMCSDSAQCENGTSVISHLLAARVNLSTPALVHHRLGHADRLHLIYDDTYVGIVDLQIKADTLDIIFPGSNVEVHQVTVAPKSSHGMVAMDVLLRNMGLVTSRVTVHVTCGHQDGRTHEVVIHPSQVHLVEFELLSEGSGVNHTCLVEVQGLGARVVAKMDVWYLGDDRCFCLLDCLCRCGSSVEALSCETVSNAEYKARGFQGNINKWKINVQKPRRGFFRDTWRMDLGLVTAGLLFFGFLKAVLGVTASPSTGMFGFSACTHEDRVLPRGTNFVLNIIFTFLAPWLFIFWINHLIAVKVRECPQVDGKREQLPLLPRQSWTEAISGVENSTPARISDTEMSADVLDQYSKHKPDAIEQHQMEEMPQSQQSDESSEPPPSPFKEAQEQGSLLTELLEPGQMVFCHYSEAHPALINSGEYYSLCGQLMAINPGLYRFTIELNQTQVYENEVGHAHSLVNLHPLQADQFTRILTELDVLQLISLKPREPCLNKVL